MGGVSCDTFAAALRAQLPTARRRAAFSSVEEIAPHARQDVVEVSPRGGTLVLFDSVCVPHCVRPVVDGERVALAGWFHEDQQSWPAWFTEAAD